MDTTKELLDRALNMKPAKHWCERYNISQSYLSTAKKMKHLSPVLAGNLAIDLGEDAQHWITIAALETERQHPMNERLKKILSETIAR